jgi:hypothetical protein
MRLSSEDYSGYAPSALVAAGGLTGADRAAAAYAER